MKAGKDGHVLLFLHEISPSPDNLQLYRAVSEDDPAVIKLAESIRRNGIREPLVVSADGYIISGHRRYFAALMAGLRKVPCRMVKVKRGDGKEAPPEYLRLMVEYNAQRSKTSDEVLREAIVSVDPEKAHQDLTAYRKRKAGFKSKAAAIHLREGIPRKQISEAKREFLAAVQRVIADLEEFWPVSLRQIHYGLLNAPPLIHLAKPESTYRNDLRSYHSLSDLVTRARHEGDIDYEVIADPTRPVDLWRTHKNLATYYAQQTEELFNDYARDLLQSQPNQIEVVVEKNTLHGILSPVAAQFCAPLTIGRGQCSTPRLFEIAQRYHASGKEQLILLALSDLDPDGDAIAHSLGQRLRDDYGIPKIKAFRVALSFEQVNSLQLPESYQRAKTTSTNYGRYVETHGSDLVFELEAVEPAVLQKWLTDALDSVTDRAAFNAEVKREREDAAHLKATRQIVLETLRQHQK